MACVAGVTATPQRPLSRTWVGVDVGVKNLGLALVTRTALCAFSIQVLRAELVDLMEPMCDPATCPLHHSGMASDRVAHLLQKYQDVFDSADEIVVERQPPSGIRDIEQCIVTAFRAKIHMMQPRTLHVALGSNGMAYDQRKTLSKCFASQFTDLSRFGKQDDVADAVAMAVIRAQQWNPELDVAYVAPDESVARPAWKTWVFRNWSKPPLRPSPTSTKPSLKRPRSEPPGKTPPETSSTSVPALALPPPPPAATTIPRSSTSNWPTEGELLARAGTFVPTPTPTPTRSTGLRLPEVRPVTGQGSARVVTASRYFAAQRPSPHPNTRDSPRGRPAILPGLRCPPLPPQPRAGT